MSARDLLADLTGAGFTVTADGDRLVIRPASRLNEGMRAALMAAKPALLKLLATPADTVTQHSANGERSLCLDRRARLIRWGWPQSVAENVAEHLANRNRSLDERVSCVDCRNYQPGRQAMPGNCGNHRRAGLSTPVIGQDLAALLQRCPGFLALGG